MQRGRALLLRLNRPVPNQKLMEMIRDAVRGPAFTPRFTAELYVVDTFSGKVRSFVETEPRWHHGELAPAQSHRLF